MALVAAASEKHGKIEQALIAGIKSGSAEPWTDDEWQLGQDRIVGLRIRNASLYPTDLPGHFLRLPALTDPRTFEF